MGGRTVTKTFFHGKSTLPPPRHQVNSCPSQSNCSSFPHPRWREDCCTRMNFVCLPLSKNKMARFFFFACSLFPHDLFAPPRQQPFFPSYIRVISRPTNTQKKYSSYHWRASVEQPFSSPCVYRPRQGVGDLKFGWP